MKIKPVENGGVRVELGPEEAQLPATSRDTPANPVFKLKEILVPVDFTECTDKALFYAVPFARQFGARITLLHVIEEAFVPASEMGIILDVDTSSTAQRELDKLRARVAGQARCQAVIRKGRAQTEIIAAAKELGCDLIILSTHGRTGLEHLLLGSTAQKVIRRAGCPIFVVRPHEHDFIDPNADDWDVGNSEWDAEVEAEMKASL
jgi:nucleotide-binding universal stress UspA family protein